MDGSTALNDKFLSRLAPVNAAADAAQRAALETCAGVATDIIEHFGQTSRPRPLRRLMGRLRAEPEPVVRGIYLWGSVGRGKTVMMDAVMDALAPIATRRVHFHRFMLEIHERLKTARLEETDPLRRVGQEISRETQVLGFDEFQVFDIGDAMILSGLLKSLVENHVTLLFTSNLSPDDLYTGGLQRDRFVPAINLIKSCTHVIHLGGGRDYRLETLHAQPSYHSPSDEQAIQKMHELLLQIDPKAHSEPSVIVLNQRPIPVRAKGNGVIWFDFEALCDGPRSKADYVELSRGFHTVMMSDVPQLEAEDDNAARRFIELIDELYDRKVNLIVSAETAPEHLYRGLRLKDEFQRTVSRLYESQSSEYLAQAHRP